MACVSSCSSSESFGEADFDESFEEVLVEVESGTTEIMLIPKLTTNGNVDHVSQKSNTLYL